MSKLKALLFGMVVLVGVLAVVAMAENETAKSAEPVITGTDEITDEYITKEVTRAKTYYLVLLKGTQKEETENTDSLKTLHLKQIFALKAQGKMAIAGPIIKQSELEGICIYTITDEAEVTALVNADPLVKAGYLKAEIYPWMGLSGDKLP
jgi:uncharacterized protein YciI